MVGLVERKVFPKHIFGHFWGRFNISPLGTFIPECQRNVHGRHKHCNFSPHKDATMHLHLISKPQHSCKTTMNLST
ncbi:hypothetical protein H5410_036034 [Solanum commersonii]|uniref:Uncharacterized protein n=1 Tax=Solanum commersonii TaxID=4109 RepID=A0A9J5Y490_SOLCO|nr:hypothetical protein H5410_036034 [Solanum commersonii]